MQLSHEFTGAVAVFDERNLVSCAGLSPVLDLAEQAGLSELIAAKVSLRSVRVKSAGVNPAGKLTSIVAGMVAGADSIDDLEVIRSGGMARLFAGVYASATLGQFLREFTWGHTRQLGSVARAHLVALVERTDCLPGIGSRCFVDIDSLLRPVYGHQKQGASFGHTKVASRQVLQRGLSPLATTISTDTAAPMIAGIRLRAGKAGSGRGAASMVAEAINAARAAGAGGTILVRGDAAYGSWPVIQAAVGAGAEFSLVLTKNPAVARAMATIGEDAWIPVAYPGSVIDPDTEELISDAHVAEVTYTAFAATDHPVTARLIVRRVRDLNHAHEDTLFPVWRYHPFFTNSTEPTVEADITHRRHAIIETTFADLISGPLAHLPSGAFAANSAWAICAGITHNLLRAAGTLAGANLAVARGATLRTRIINVPARLARPQRRPMLHLPAHWPWCQTVAPAIHTPRERTGPTGTSLTPAHRHPRPNPNTTVEKLAQASGTTTPTTKPVPTNTRPDQRANPSTDSGSAHPQFEPQPPSDRLSPTSGRTPATRTRTSESTAAKSTGRPNIPDTRWPQPVAHHRGPRAASQSPVAATGSRHRPWLTSTPEEGPIPAPQPAPSHHQEPVETPD